MARVPLELEEFGISYQRLAPGFRVPFAHTHKNQEEVYVVVSGSMRVKLGDDIVEAEPVGRGSRPKGDDAVVRRRPRGRRGDRGRSAQHRPRRRRGRRELVGGLS